MSRPASVLVRTDALRHNMATLRAAAPGTRLMAVVKADAYGHGAAGLVEALSDADALAVASLDEALALRAAGATQPVVLLEGVFAAGELPRAARAGCELVVHAPWQIDALAASEDAFVVWLKVDTGMGRLGFRVEDAAAARARLSACAAVRELRSMTHLACADERDSGMTRRQLDLFSGTTRGWGGVRSIANSAGVLAWPDAHADWIRPGLALYGLSPFPEDTGTAHSLRPVMELHSELIAVRDLHAGETTGYGAAWTAKADTRIGIAGIGYGDGYPRHAAPGTPVLVNGKPVPLAGHVSMDMLAVDLGTQPDARTGDPVLLWGEGLPVEDIARASGTIPWTLVCGVSDRVARQLTS